MGDTILDTLKDGTQIAAVTGTVAVTGGLTDAELRATPVIVTVSGAAPGLTDTELRASPVPVSGTFYQVTQPVSGTVTANAGTGTMAVSATSLPLPSGAATEAKQDTGNTSLSGIKTILDDVKDTVNAAITGAHPVLDTRSILFAVNQSGVYGNIERTNGGNLKVSVEEVIGTVPVSGTVTANTGLSQPLTDTQLRNSAVPVSGAFYQATQPVSAISLPLPTDASTAAKQDACNTSLSNIDGKLNSLGQKASSGSVPVVLASDQSALTVTPGQISSSTATLTSVASSATTVSLLATNANRRAAYLYNDSNTSVFVAFAATATSSAFTQKMGPGGFWEIPGEAVYRGAISGIWESANGSMRLTELT